MHRDSSLVFDANGAAMREMEETLSRKAVLAMQTVGGWQVLTVVHRKLRHDRGGMEEKGEKGVHTDSRAQLPTPFQNSGRGEKARPLANLATWYAQ